MRNRAKSVLPSGKSRLATRDLDVGQRPALRRVAPVLMEESFEERFTFGVAKLLR